jgi:hypothetical protein
MAKPKIRTEDDDMLDILLTQALEKAAEQKKIDQSKQEATETEADKADVEDAEVEEEGEDESEEDESTSSVEIPITTATPTKINAAATTPIKAKLKKPTNTPPAPADPSSSATSVPLPDPVPRTPEQIQQENERLALLALHKNAMQVPLEHICPSVIKVQPLTEKEIREIYDRFSVHIGVPLQFAIVAIYILFLKGAANTGTPTSLEIEILDEHGCKITVTKNDLVFIYKKVTNNSFLRRLAESLAVNICMFAEYRNLSGDLANKINTKLISKKEPPLTLKERAWCSSFCQNIVNFEILSSERLQIELANDYISTKEKAKKKTLPNPPPAKSAKALKAQAKQDTADKKAGKGGTIK